MSCSQSIWPWVSSINGVASFASSFVSLFPQIIETYRDKTVAGLSPLFLLAWVGGDLTSLIGAILTNQLAFQIILALYFLLNDSVVCGQYYYYGILHGNRLATAGHETKRSLNSNPDRQVHSNTRTTGLWQKFLSIFWIAGISNALPISQRDSNTSPPSTPLPSPESPLGTMLSWTGAAFYVGARIPQLIKNYKRKSTDGISPILFATTLLCNLTYNFSILTSCAFLESQNKVAFLWNAAPFIVGSAGTVAFDLLYFYQHYVLYADDLHDREESSRGAIGNSSQSINNQNEERAPLLD